MVTDGVNGFLAPLGDIRRFADVLLKLGQDGDLRKSLGEQSRRTILQRFTLQQQAVSCKEIYHRLLAGSEPTAQGSPQDSPSASPMVDWGRHWGMIFHPLLREAQRLRRSQRGGVLKRVRRELKRLAERWTKLQSKRAANR
jgi:hypothetical protein